MSVDLYKAEANRLADHLATIHGIKLKHTSVLAAIATLHGARDWNTLIARPKPGLFERAAAALSPASAAEPSVVVGIDDLLYDLPTGGLRFGLHHNAAAPAAPRKFDLADKYVDVSDRNLLRHTLVVGPTGYGWSTLLEALAVQQVIRGGGLLVLDSRSDLHMPRLLQQATRSAGRTDNFTLLLDDSQEPLNLDVVDYDLFAGDNIADIADRLMAAALPPSDNNPGADFYRSQCREFLSISLNAMKAAGMPLNLKQLASQVLEIEQLAALAEKVKDVPEVGEQITKFLERFIKRTKNGTELDAAAYRNGQAFSALISRLFLLTSEKRSATRRTRNFSVEQVLKQGQVGYVTGCCTDNKNGLVRGVLNELMRVFDLRRAEQSRSGRTTEHPFLLVVPNLTSVLDAGAIRRLLQTAVEANVALVFHVSSLSVLDEVSTSFADDVLTNTRLKVFFKQLAPRAFEQALSCLEYAAGSASPEARQARRERFMDLGMGEALFCDGRAVCDLRIRMVTSPSA